MISARRDGGCRSITKQANIIRLGHDSTQRKTVWTRGATSWKCWMIMVGLHRHCLRGERRRATSPYGQALMSSWRRVDNPSEPRTLLQLSCRRDHPPPRSHHRANSPTPSAGLSGRFVPRRAERRPRPGHGPASCRRGGTSTCIDIHTIPTETGVEGSARRRPSGLIEKYRGCEHDGQYPRSVRHRRLGHQHDADPRRRIAEILHLLGVRPVWVAESRRLKGVELVPLAELGRGRGST